MDNNYLGPAPIRLCLALCVLIHLTHEFNKFINVLIIFPNNGDRVVTKISALMDLMRRRQAVNKQINHDIAYQIMLIAIEKTHWKHIRSMCRVESCPGMAHWYSNIWEWPKEMKGRAMQTSVGEDSRLNEQWIQISCSRSESGVSMNCMEACVTEVGQARGRCKKKWEQEQRKAKSTL